MKAAVRTAVFSYIEGWYNPARRHSGIRYLSPVAYEMHRVNSDGVKVLEGRGAGAPGASRDAHTGNYPWG